MRCAEFGARLSLFLDSRPSLPDAAAAQEEVIRAVNDLITIDAVTSSALGFWTDEPVIGPRCASPLARIKGTGVPATGPSFPAVKGTGLPFIGTGAYALGAGAMGTDPVQGIAVRGAVAAVQGDPPRRTPSRC
jgi:hypothetical protein